jgi:type IV secretion system protein VirB6
LDPVAAAAAGLGSIPDAPLVAAAFHIFQSAWDAIDTPLEAAVAAIIAQLVSFLLAPMKAFAIAWIAALAIKMAVSQSPSVGHMFADILRIAIAFFVVSSAANFNQWGGDLLLKGLPNEVGAVVTGAVGSGGLPPGGAVFDNIWNDTWKAGEMAIDALPYSLKSIGLVVIIGICMVFSIAAIGLAFLMMLGSHVMLALVVAVGPLFVAAAAFPVSRGYFRSWLNAALGAVTAQVLVLALLGIMLVSQKATIATLLNGGQVANIGSQIGALLGLAALLFLCGILAMQIPSLAAQLTGGVSQSFAPFLAGAAGAAAAAGRGASKLFGGGSAPAAGGGGGSRGAGAGLAPIPGRALG